MKYKVFYSSMEADRDMIYKLILIDFSEIIKIEKALNVRDAYN